MAPLERLNTVAAEVSKISSSEQPEFLERITTAASNIKSRFHVRSVYASGPATFLNPTNVRMRMKSTTGDDLQDSCSDIAFIWRSRDNRKRRRSIAIPRQTATGPSKAPLFSGSFNQVQKGILAMFTVFPFDLAYLVGLSFTIGSTLFVANGFICLLPVAFPAFGFDAASKDISEGLTSFLGASAFEVGAILAYLEAVNDGSFHGSFMKRFIRGNEDEEKQLTKLKMQAFLRRLNRADRTANAENTDDLQGLPSMPDETSVRRRDALDLGADLKRTRQYSAFRWWPTWENLKKHYVFEIGWLACTTQLVSSTLYMVVGTADLPGVMDKLNSRQQGFAYSYPNIVASAGFMIASLLFAFETQDKWYKPQPRILGWWIGLLAFLGSLGFELCATLGTATFKSHLAELHSDIATLWASLCFLLGSILQWYEAVNKQSVEELFDQPANMQSFDIHI